MALNADPKPGRWILPLVVLGMVAFTYFFVRALPSGSDEAGSDTTLPSANTTLPREGNGEDVAEPPPVPEGNVDPATQAYLDGVGSILSSMEGLQREMATVNGGFDADPREVEYSDAVDRLTALAEAADGLVGELDALEPPPSLSTNHETIRTAVTTAAAAADEALAGLQSDDDGTQRRNAVTAFDTAVSDLQTAVANARSAAGLAATPPTEAPADTTGDTSPDTTGGEGEGEGG